MASQHINAAKVTNILVHLNDVLKHMNANQAEVMLACQELTGRVIVDMSGTPVGASTLVEAAKKHLDDTVRIGLQAKGQLIARA